MLTQDDVKQIMKQLSAANMVTSDDHLSEDVSCIVYRTDLFECGDNHMVSRHIDIEFAFGDYYELHDGEELFQYICSLCSLQELASEEEIILYQNPI